MILLEAGYVSDFQAEVDISVDDLAEKLKMDRVEIRNLFKYMIDLGYIEVKSIGGPVLYGHISLTNKGLNKAVKLNNR
jgi:Mn-dependent DtxR family transcriptional regulator